MSLIFVSCSAPLIKPVKVDTPTSRIDYVKDVKPILDKRCVTCHSCYNAPCQSKFSSYEGVDRGGSKIAVYDAMRLSSIDPTRLFMDAQTTGEWREKGFYDLTKSMDTNASYNDSIMMHMLHNKKENPEIIGSYDPENEELVCPKDKQELSDYFAEKKHHGMPYGLPQIEEKEYVTLSGWLLQGAKGPTVAQQKKLESPSDIAAKEIKKWEAFLNTSDAKHKMTARYLYEHLFLSHLYFDTSTTEFFEIVRSSTPSEEPIEVIATIRPFDNPGSDVFYYRLRKVHSTIVHKTHMVFELSDSTLQRYNELFIKPKWDEEPHVVSYDPKVSANPFLAFAQIPVRARYQFLLDNSHYTIMTFIRGPVCRGQMAVNVIEDHFWVMFKDPDYDTGVQDPKFLLSQADNLSLPIETVSENVFKAFSDEYRDRYHEYYEAKEKKINNEYPQGLPIESIWKGNTAKDAPILSIYRHFNSASVHKGVLGEEPKTMWVIDYAQLERIYYALVAGYDVFGNLAHQTNIRRYTDFLRFEGELGFIGFMPNDKRLEMWKSWYIGDNDVQDKTFTFTDDRATAIKYKTSNPKQEFIEKVVYEHILKSTKIDFDEINYVKSGEKLPEMPRSFKVKQDFLTGLKSITGEGTGFIKHITEGGFNNIFIRVKLKDATYIPIYMVINRWHDNVNSLMGEESLLNPDKDTIDVLFTNPGSYPNVYVDISHKDLPDFFDLIQNYNGTISDKVKIDKYFISRANENFWVINDWFQDYLNKTKPISAGLYDLNRYHKHAW